MSRLLGSELLKLRTTRTTTALAMTAAGLGALMAALIISLSAIGDLTGDVGGRLVLSSGGITAGVLALLLGVVATAGEFRHGTILPTLLVTPGRRRVVAAQATAAALAGALVGAASVAATFVVSLPLLAYRDVAVTLSKADLAGIAFGGTGFAALSAALGAALGVLVRSQVIAVSLALLVLFVAEPLITTLVDGYQRYSLIGIRVAITGGAAQSAGAPDGGLPPLWLAVLLWAGYAAALLVAATVAGARRDVS